LRIIQLLEKEQIDAIDHKLFKGLRGIYFNLDLYSQYFLQYFNLFCYIDLITTSDLFVTNFRKSKILYNKIIHNKKVNL